VTKFRRIEPRSSSVRGRPIMGRWSAIVNGPRSDASDHDRRPATVVVHRRVGLRSPNRCRPAAVTGPRSSSASGRRRPAVVGRARGSHGRRRPAVVVQVGPPDSRRPHGRPEVVIGRRSVAARHGVSRRRHVGPRSSESSPNRPAAVVVGLQSSAASGSRLRPA
jgi:hypothetical protein